MAEFRVITGRGDRWLVRDGGRLFVVPGALARELQEPGGRARWRQLAPPPRADARSRRDALWLRVCLLPARWADALARLLAPLACTRALVVLVVVGVGGLVGAAVAGRPASGAITADERVAGLVLFIVTALVHELGHAAALRHEGLPAGRVGAGLLWILPVLYCDVTASGLLPRPGRVRVDVAGMVFQVAAAGVLASGAVVSGHVAPWLGATGAVIAVMWSATPLLRADGHWLLLDLLGLDDLAASPPRGWCVRHRRLLAVLAIWRVATILALTTAIVWLPWRVLRLAARLGAPGWSAGIRVVLWSGLAALFGLGAWRAGKRILGLLRALFRDGRY